MATRPGMARIASAKVNLTLALTGRRPDGYHELASVFVRVGLSDRLLLEPAMPVDVATADSLVVEDDPDCPVEGNLVLRAANAVRVALDKRDAASLPGRAAPPGGRVGTSLAFRLSKRIPMGAGLAGGSSDAAAALDLASAALGLHLSSLEQLSIGARLGADVPFFVSGHAAALVTGFGQYLKPLPAPRGGFGLLLVTPAVRLATRDVFAAYDGFPLRSSPAAELTADLATMLADGLEGAALVAMASELRDANDLWPAAAAIAPQLQALRGALEEWLGRPFLLTGSGSTLVGLYASVADAAGAGRAVVSAGLPAVDDARLFAIDLTNPDPTWRFP